MKVTIRGRKMTIKATVEGTLDQKLAFLTAITGADFTPTPPAPNPPTDHLWTDEEVQAMKDRGEISTDAPPPATDEVDDIPF